MKTLTTLRRFRKDERGTVGLIFGLSVIPLMGLTGVAVDFARVSSVRGEMQVAADATALALAKDMNAGTTSQINARADAIFKANWNGRFDSSMPTITVTKTGDRFRVQATTRLDYALLPIIGLSGTDIGVSAQSGWGVNKIEIALVLDNTGSMGWSNKLPELKKALCGDLTCSTTTPTSGFVKQMKDAAREDDQIRVAIVPFDTTVRVPLATETAMKAASPLTGTFAYTGAGYCNGNPTTARSASWVRFADRDRNTTRWVWDPATSTNVDGSCLMAHRTTQANWQGCLWDRDQDGNRDTKPSGVDPGNVNTLYPAVACRSNNLARMAPLVDVRTQSAGLITALAAMQPSGNTNLTIGATWGANMLTPGFPLSTANPSATNLQRFMILLTDGNNTENRRTGNSGQIDARAKLACDAAKAQGIIIYSIRVIEGNQTLLKQCASGDENYYEVATASQISTVFDSIAGKINAIRLTQ